MGKYPLTVKLVSGKDAFERPLVLNVNQDALPSIPGQTLPAVSLDTYVFQPFKVAGGVGTVTWSLGEGKLPYGIMLSPAGILVGTPGEAGTFSFTIKAQDSHPAGPRAAEKAFHWKIGPARPDALQVKYVITQGYDLEQIRVPHDKDRKPIPANSAIKMDGKLDEPFWKLDQPIAKRTQGSPTKKATFSAVWTANCSGNTIPGTSPSARPFLCGRAEAGCGYWMGSIWFWPSRFSTGPKARPPRTACIFFWMAGMTQRSSMAPMICISSFHRTFKSDAVQRPGPGSQSPWFSKAAVAEIEGGYSMKFRSGGPT